MVTVRGVRKWSCDDLSAAGHDVCPHVCIGQEMHLHATSSDTIGRHSSRFAATLKGRGRRISIRRDIGAGRTIHSLVTWKAAPPSGARMRTNSFTNDRCKSGTLCCRTMWLYTKVAERPE
jgi:hypothetical protein